MNASLFCETEEFEVDIDVLRAWFLLRVEGEVPNIKRKLVERDKAKDTDEQRKEGRVCCHPPSCSKEEVRSSSSPNIQIDPVSFVQHQFVILKFAESALSQLDISPTFELHLSFSSSSLPICCQSQFLSKFPLFVPPEQHRIATEFYPQRNGLEDRFNSYHSVSCLSLLPQVISSVRSLCSYPSQEVNPAHVSSLVNQSGRSFVVQVFHQIPSYQQILNHFSSRFNNSIDSPLVTPVVVAVSSSYLTPVKLPYRVPVYCPVVPRSPFDSYTSSPIDSFTRSPIVPFTRSPFDSFTISPFDSFTISPFDSFTIFLQRSF